MDRIKLEVRPRDGRGGKDARRLRAGGGVPGVVYGAKTGPGASIPVVVNIRDLRHALAPGPDVSGGELIGPRMLVRGTPRAVPLTAAATDPVAAGWLWAESIRLTGVEPHPVTP